MSNRIQVTDREVTFHPKQIIVSKTDLKGRITYCNDVFLEVAGYTEKELLGQPHSIIRHPDMPRSVFHLLWSTIEDKQEIFAYVKNRTKKGDYYWVLAHVTPSYDQNGVIDGYHSNRRVPDPKVIKEVITPLYANLLRIEQEPSNRKQGMQSAVDELHSILETEGVGYAEFISKFAFAS